MSSIRSLLSVLALSFAPHIGAVDRAAEETLPEDARKLLGYSKARAG